MEVDRRKEHEDKKIHTERGKREEEEQRKTEEMMNRTRQDIQKHNTNVSDPHQV